MGKSSQHRQGHCPERPWDEPHIRVDTLTEQARSNARWLVLLFVVARQYQRRRRARPWRLPRGRLDYVDAGVMNFIDREMSTLEAGPLVGSVPDCENAISWSRFLRGVLRVDRGPYRNPGSFFRNRRSGE